MPGVDYESMLSELGKFGASFVLATQSLAKLDDLSRTMRDTILANVGCLAVFQVAGNDARTLVCVSARQADYADADGHRKVGDYRKGVEDLENARREEEAEE